MAVNEYHCLNSLDDRQIGTDANTGDITMDAREIWDIGASSQGRATLDTSAIGSDTITAATLHWYTHVDSTKFPKANTWAHAIRIIGGSTIYENTTAKESAGWSSHALTGGELAEINTSGDTEFEFAVGAVGSSTYSRLWFLRTWDHTPNGDYSVYLEVTHAAAGGPTKMTVVSV